MKGKYCNLLPSYNRYCIVMKLFDYLKNCTLAMEDAIANRLKIKNYIQYSKNRK